MLFDTLRKRASSALIAASHALAPTDENARGQAGSASAESEAGAASDQDANPQTQTATNMRPGFDQGVFDEDRSEDADRFETLLGKLDAVGALQNVQTVLDLGCGRGASIRALRAALPDARIIGIDRVAAFQSSVEGLGAQFACADLAGGLDESAFPQIVDQTFDLVIANASLNHVPHAEHVLTFAYRLVKPGGSFALAQEGSGPNADLNRYLQQAAIEANLVDANEARSFDWPAFYEARHVIIRVLRDAGFNDIQAERVQSLPLSRADILERFSATDLPYYLERIYGPCGADPEGKEETAYHAKKDRLMAAFENVCEVSEVRRLSPAALYVIARKSADGQPDPR